MSFVRSISRKTTLIIISCLYSRRKTINEIVDYIRLYVFVKLVLINCIITDVPKFYFFF